MKKIVTLLSILFLSAGVARAQEDVLIDEDAMFSDEVSVESNMSTNVVTPMEKEELVFSGNLLSRTGYSIKRSWFEGDTPGDTNKISAGMQGNLNLDIRLRKGFKSHLGMYVNYSTGNSLQPLLDQLGPFASTFSPILNSLTSDTSISFPEFFADVNIGRKVYFRIGKQVLQWGRSLLWNPTDLINVDRESFLDNFQVKGGVPGIKMHIPIGTAFNLYTFFDATGAEAIDDFAAAAKIELVLGRTEIGLSAWAKEEKLPVYGVDFSSRIGLFDIYGEASLSEGENREKVGSQISSNTYEILQDTSNFIARVSIGIRRSFDLVYDDRVMISGEFYYNSTGYGENVFTDSDKVTYMYQNGYYRPYDHAQYYGALFLTVNQFFLNQDLTWNLNGLGNFNDSSFVVSTSLYYKPIFNLNLGLTVTAFLGPEEAEFTYGDQGSALEMTAQYVF